VRVSAPTRIPSLDGIRAVAIGLVIISHFSKDYGWGDPLDLGSLGVRIFFVISGFLITGLLLKEMDGEGRIDLARFYFRRTLRIFPAFYFYLLCMLVLSLFGGADLSFSAALPALTYTSNYVQSLHPDVAHTWSLATEEQFYLIWPAALFLAGRKRRAVAVLLLLIIVASLSSRLLTRQLGHSVPAFFNTPIGVGCLLALTQERLRRVTAYRAWLGAPWGALVPIVFLVANVPGWHVAGAREALLSLLQNLSIALWLDWAVSNGGSLSGRLLNARAMVIIGVGSYSLYLWQQPFLGLLYTEPTLLLKGPWRILAEPWARLGCIVACTLFSYLLVERPLMRIRSRLEPYLFKPRPALEKA
jgi:peptidoglycan/LPS O-acetylase OafA/YrhL